MLPVIISFSTTLIDVVVAVFQSSEGMFIAVLRAFQWSLSFRPCSMSKASHSVLPDCDRIDAIAVFLLIVMCGGGQLNISSAGSSGL